MKHPLAQCIHELFEGNPEAQKRLRLGRRIEEVRDRWLRAVDEVYGPSAEEILKHINAVVSMRAGDVRGIKVPARLAAEDIVFLVYCDDSLIRSDLDMRQEFLKARLIMQGERIDSFLVIPSTWTMRDRHPFVQGGKSSEKSKAQEQRAILQKLAAQRSTERLSASEEAFVQESLKVLEEGPLRDAAEAAMKACMRK